MLIDHRRAGAAARVSGNELALDRGGGEPLVPEPDRERRKPGKIAGKGAGRLGARAFAAVHVDGQAQHIANGLPLAGERDQARRVGRESLAAHGLDGGGEPPLWVARRNPDRLGAQIKPDQRAARGQKRRDLDERKDGGGHGAGPRAGWLFFASSSRSTLLLEHELFRKPVSAFRAHALTCAGPNSQSRRG